MEQPIIQVPHVVFLPLSLHGHFKPMLTLAKLFGGAGFQVTFLTTQRSHDSILMSLDTAEFRFGHPEFEFLAMPDPVLPPRDRPGTGLTNMYDKMIAMASVIKPALAELFVSTDRKLGQRQPVTCVVADGFLSSTVADVADEFRIPVFAFRTSSAGCIWSYFHLSKLIEEGDVPVLQDKDMDKPVTCIPGLENIVRRRDLPEIFRIEKVNDPIFQSFIKDQTLGLQRAYALILNTFDEAEGSVIDQLPSHFPKVYTIGPLHGLCNYFFSNDPKPSKSSNQNEDTSCMTWLDSQSSKSVLFVSFGTLISLTRYQLLEFGYGLLNSDKPFLWAIRPESVKGESDPGLVLTKLKDIIKDKGLVVNWVPQEEVLSHPAIGGFLTHCGWNSILESLYAGVPMICWPAIADQHINSRYVEEVWKVGFDMKDSCDRLTIEKMVRDLLEDKREEIMKSVSKFKMLTRKTANKGGASFSNFARMMDEIRSMSR